MPPKSTSTASSSRRGKPSISRSRIWFNFASNTHPKANMTFTAPAGAKRGSTSADPSSSKRRRETTDTIELASVQDDEDLDMFSHSEINNDLTMLGSDEEEDEEEQPETDTNGPQRRRQMQRKNRNDSEDADDSDRYQPQQESDAEEQQEEAVREHTVARATQEVDPRTTQV